MSTLQPFGIFQMRKFRDISRLHFGRCSEETSLENRHTRVNADVMESFDLVLDK